MEEEKTAWWQWCRLCAREDPEHNINISLNAELSTAIGKFFWVNIKSVDITQHICKDCYTMVNLLVTFTERVNKVQAMLCMLQNAKTSEPLDPYEIRSQYGLLDEDWEHFIRSEHTKEDSIYDERENLGADIKLNDFEESEEDQLAERLLNQEDENIERESVDLNINSEIVENTSQDHNNRNLNSFKNLTDSNGESEVIVDCNDNSEEENEFDGVVELNGTTEEEDENAEKSKKIIYDRNSCRKSAREIKRRKIVNEENEFKRRSQEAKSSHKYICSVCGKIYKNPTSFRNHMQNTHNIKADVPDFICDKCGKVFPTERQLLAHERSHLPLEEKLVVPCPYCEKKFTMESVMKLHVNSVHNNDKPYICEECGQRLKSMSSFNDHKLIHTDECPYECEICKKKFKSKSRLKIHMDTHTETIYMCNQCGLQLNTKRTLKMHMLVHSEEKAFKCNLCDAEFKRIKALKNHLIVHIGLRPYKCSFCDKTFTNGSNCRTHKKKLHPIELAAEEAAGLKTERTSVPKISELRSCDVVKKQNIVHKARSHKGLPPKMRALLLAAEKRSKNENEIPTRSQANKKRKLLEHYELQTTEDETQLMKDEDGEHSEYYDEEDCAETVIYEIVDEVKL